MLKVRAWASGLTASAVRRADFMITGAIAAGRVHSVALKADGAVYAWGTNAQGQLGDGTTTQRLTPVSILTGVVSIAAGDRHTLAAKTDGTVWAWGSASSGRLGNGGSSGQQNAPVQATFSGAVAVAAGESHSLVLKSDGTVWSFGSNADGELGDGTTTDRTTAVQVVGLTGISAIAAGRNASYAIETDSAGSGIVWAWGLNDQGQLGDGSLVSRSTPTRVPGVAAAVAIAASADGAFAMAKTATGQLFSWGHNHKGQLGVGTSTESSDRGVKYSCRRRRGPWPPGSNMPWPSM